MLTNGKIISVTLLARPFTLICSLFSIVCYAQPTINSFTPVSGPIGTTIIISGTNFDPVASNNIVYFGAVAGIVNNSTGNTLTVKVPIGTTYQLITITVNNLTAYSKLPFHVTFPGAGTAFTSTSLEQPYKSFNVDLYPYNISSADLNGDGRPEIVTANYQGNTFSLLKNNSTYEMISFENKIDFPVGNYADGIFTGDLDADGRLDVAVTTWESSKVSLFRNTSTGGLVSFDPKIDYSTGTNPSDLAIADIDLDGKPDLIVTNENSHNISVLRNTGTPGVLSFDAAINFGTGFNPEDIMIRDIDNDGKPDVVVCTIGTDQAVILRNNSTAGNISFDPKVEFPVGIRPFGIAVADLDGDGNTDIVTANNGSGTISLLRNSSSPGLISFNPAVTIATGSYPQDVAIGDIDGDGKVDIATTGSTTGFAMLFLLKNQSTLGNFNFATKVSYASGSYSKGIAITDLNKDGKPDLAITSVSGNKISVFKNKIGAAREFCQNGNNTITSNLTGTNYQWQLDTGTGFLNIADNINYAGTNTMVLQLQNVPTSWLGYQYRCIVDGDPGATVALRFVNTWTGSVNTAWETPGNWSCNIIPDNNTDVIMNNGISNINVNTSIHSVTLNGTANLRVKTGKVLTVNH